MKRDMEIRRMDKAVSVIIVVGLILAAILVAAGAFKCKHHTWHKMYEDNSIIVEKCDCGQERFITK